MWPFPAKSQRAEVFSKTMFTQLLVAIAIGFTSCSLLNKVLIMMSRRTGIVLDNPGNDARRVHDRPTPRIGGPSLILSFGLTLLLVLPTHLWHNQQIRGFAVGAVLMALLGTIDDVKEIGGKAKLIAQIAIVSLVVVKFQLIVPYINNPLGGTINFPYGVSIGIAILWILATTNTMNFIDGIDGLATSMALVFSIVVGWISLLFDQPALALFLSTLLGCCLGFLPFNWHRARAFLGDGGSMFFGFSVGVLSILVGAKLATTILILGLPIIDVINTFVIRVSRGQSLFVADREHLHYRLISKGMSTGKAVFLISGVSLAFGLLALPSNTTVKTLGMVALFIVSELIIYWSMRK
jgi:UDP-GlcNAc:undecaprenyl-phosphate GlcNAc-1-phosphate transferase